MTCCRKRQGPVLGVTQKSTTLRRNCLMTNFGCGAVAHFTQVADSVVS